MNETISTYSSVIEEMIHFISHKKWLLLGDNFFKSVTTFLIQKADADYLFIDQIDTAEKKRKNLYFASQKDQIENLNYNDELSDYKADDSNNICINQLIFIQNLNHHHDSLGNYYDSTFLNVPVLSSANQIIGSITYISSKELKNKQIIETLLHIVAIQATLELNDYQYKTELEICNTKLSAANKKIQENSKELEILKKNVFETSKQFLILFEQASIGVAIVESKSRRFAKINNRFNSLLGYDDDDLLDCNFLEITHPGDLQVNLKNFGKIISGETTEFTMEIRYLHKLGFVVWVMLSVSPILKEDGNFSYYMFVIQDINEHKNIELALKESESKFRHYFELPLIGMAITSMEKQWLEVNNKLCEILGYTKEELLLMTWNQITFEEDLDVEISNFNKILNEELESYTLDKRFIRKDGTIIYTLITVRCVKDIYDRIKFFLVLVQNITDRKIAEEKLKQQNEELIKARQKAEESDRLKSAFLANMSHEIRTPMNGIIGFAEMLTIPDYSDEDRQQFIEVINDSCQQLLRIVNDIIDISKIETGQIEINEISVSLSTMLSDIYTFHYRLAANKGITLVVNNQENIQHKILADPTKLRQIFDNLISNAVKFTNEGTITVGYELKNQEIQFFIKDTGVGIAEQFQHIVFERFRQVEGSPTYEKVYRGSGLGLAICKAFVEKMGGKIWFDSKPNEGSAFYFTIPYKIAWTDLGSEKKAISN